MFSKENKLDGSRLLKLPDRLIDQLVPSIGDRVVILEELNILKQCQKEATAEDCEAALSLLPVSGSPAAYHDQEEDETVDDPVPGPSTVRPTVTWHDLDDYR